MRLSFDSIEEVKEFVKALKGTRGGKDKDDEAAPTTGNAPAPLAPPTGAVAGAGFGGGGQAGFTAPPAGGAGPGAGAFPALGAPIAGPQLAPEAAAFVAKIGAVMDAAAAGPKAAEMLQWFRNSCGPDAANATSEQIKAVFLPRFNVQQLADMAKLVGAG